MIDELCVCMCVELLVMVCVMRSCKHVSTDKCVYLFDELQVILLLFIHLGFVQLINRNVLIMIRHASTMF